jgi:UMF1 family MFS transporter
LPPGRFAGLIAPTAAGGIMADITLRKRIWGWFFFDWASQPYNTLLITFIFAPYVKELMGDGTAAQSAWGFGIGAAGVVIALLAPVLGALADTGGNRLRWIWLFSLMYVVGSAGLWFAIPGDFNLIVILTFFAIGMIGMEFATTFTNSMLPDLGTTAEIGRISGNGWAFGYAGGLVALVIMLLVFADNAETGRTLAGLKPAFGLLDAEAREGTRFVGPLTAIWYVLFMVPFFLFVRDPKAHKAPEGAVKLALIGLKTTLRHLPSDRSLFAYLGSAMFYRDALNGMYAFGGIYAAGVLGWDVQNVGIFGIIAIIAGALAAWFGGMADSRFGSKPVIVTCIVILTLVGVAIVLISRETMFGVPLAPESALPDIAFYLIGALIGAAGGVLQSASRTMMVRQANPARMTEAFGLYALSGKATSFLAPLLIGVTTYLTGSQQLGVSPVIGLFLIGLVLLLWVKPNGQRAAV